MSNQSTTDRRAHPEAALAEVLHQMAAFQDGNAQPHTIALINELADVAQSLSTDLTNAEARVKEADWLKSRIAEVVEEDGGCWRPCSGCQESVDGYVSTKDYPHSEIFGCQPGSGCHECGGIGVIYDDGKFLASFGEALNPGKENV